MTKTITKTNFQKELQNGKRMLLDFWAPWCGPCRMLSPILDEIAQEQAGKVVVGKVNIDEQPDLAAQFGVMSIPTLALIENGKIIDISVGVKPKHELINWMGGH
ncbi:MAG: thioredoxin [Clostridiales bacterium]|jgi:thioredoxin 1|nr:thioredoxin [Clostridiales bacterium]